MICLACTWSTGHFSPFFSKSLTGRLTILVYMYIQLLEIGIICWKLKTWILCRLIFKTLNLIPIYTTPENEWALSFVVFTKMKSEILRQKARSFNIILNVCTLLSDAAMSILSSPFAQNIKQILYQHNMKLLVNNKLYMSSLKNKTHFHLKQNLKCSYNRSCIEFSLNLLLNLE